MSRKLDKSFITSIDEGRVYEEVPIPEWDGEVCVRSLTALEKDEFEKSLSIIRREGQRYVAVPNLTNMRGRMAALFLVDSETHERLFTTPAEAEMLGNKRASAIDRILEAGKRLSGWDDADFAKLEAELKNAPPAASASD